jgi:hypothetical protein
MRQARASSHAYIVPCRNVLASNCIHVIHIWTTCLSRLFEYGIMGPLRTLDGRPGDVWTVVHARHGQVKRDDATGQHRAVNVCRRWCS